MATTTWEAEQGPEAGAPGTGGQVAGPSQERRGLAGWAGPGGTQGGRLRGPAEVSRDPHYQ